MKFDLKTPCKDCPFLCGSSTNQSLDPQRITDIITHLIEDDDSTFTCHKTLDSPKLKQQHCGGALQYLEARNMRNQMMRIAQQLKLYNPEELIFHDKLIK